MSDEPAYSWTVGVTVISFCKVAMQWFDWACFAWILQYQSWIWMSCCFLHFIVTHTHTIMCVHVHAHTCTRTRTRTHTHDLVTVPQTHTEVFNISTTDWMYLSFFSLVLAVIMRNLCYCQKNLCSEVIIIIIIIIIITIILIIQEIWKALAMQLQVKGPNRRNCRKFLCTFKYGLSFNKYDFKVKKRTPIMMWKN